LVLSWHLWPDFQERVSGNIVEQGCSMPQFLNFVLTNGPFPEAHRRFCPYRALHCVS